MLEYRELYERVKAEESDIDGLIKKITAAAKEEGQDLREISLRIARELAAREHNEIYRLVPVNPLPTDCSYLRADDSPESLQMVIDNFPNMKMLYDVPVRQIKRVSIPTFYIAGTCKDAHKWTERLDLDFTFRDFPEILIRLLKQELNR